jgi:ArsR family transcriptional regulator, virulence genes transcriptional regulator
MAQTDVDRIDAQALARAAREMRPHAAKAAELLKALGNEQRLMILCNLVSGPLSVGELNERVALSQSALSQHLGILRDSGIVTTRRESQSVIYSLPQGVVTQIIGLLHEKFCPHPPPRAQGRLVRRDP